MSAPTKNIHHLFFRDSGDSLHNNILLPASEDGALLAARDTIRARLRASLGREMQRVANDPKLAIYPKFFMQGSRAYNTLIAPLHPPRQQADLDDGIYIPLSYAENTGSPRMASAVYTTAIWSVLDQLARERGWHATGENDNCTRVVLAPQGQPANKHVDIPAYAIPDREFMTLVERHVALNSRNDSLKKAQANVLEFAEDDQWDLMPSERVLLAHKQKGWIASDPRPIREWVAKQARLKTEQLRRLMRYLKAWRDAQQWPHGEPKSILLMVAIDAALDTHVPGRDDLALWKVVKALPAVLGGRVENPGDKNEDLAERLDYNGRQDLIQRLNRLAALLERVLVDPHLSEADIHRMLREEWGVRFPGYTPDPARHRIEVVESYAPKHIPSTPPVGDRSSG